jgi:hypothetical protein
VHWVSVGLLLGLPGPDNPWLSAVPAVAGALLLVLFLLLPQYVDRLLPRMQPGRLHTLLTETAASMRDTKPARRLRQAAEIRPMSRRREKRRMS